jgi:hypothetical protein
MSRPCIWILEQPDALLIKGRGAGHLLRGGGFKPYYVGTHRAFMLDRHRRADLMAYLESRGVPYQVTGASDAA